MRLLGRGLAVTGLVALIGVGGTGLAGAASAATTPGTTTSGRTSTGHVVNRTAYSLSNGPGGLAASLLRPLTKAVPLLGPLANVLANGQQVYGPLPSDFSPTDGASGSLYSLTTQSGARGLWQLGFTGQDVSVGVIDSGIAAVPGLTVSGGTDLTSTSGTTTAGSDGFGHGTAMAGIIAGKDVGGLTGSATGIAPGASLVDIKVAEASGWSDPSRVIAGIAWAIQHRNDPGRAPIRVLNLSYGTDTSQGYRSDPLAYAVEQAWNAGIVVVASTGNDGSSDGHLLDPAMDPFVIAVGASTTPDQHGSVASFSNTGDGTRDPDLVAPGVSLQTLRAPGSAISALVPDASGSPYIKGTGTSESAAVVSGEVALLLSARPDLTPDQVKALLMKTALPLPGLSRQVEGSGLVNLALAGIAPPPFNASQNFAPSLGNGSLDASRGAGSWIAAGATTAQAENPALMGGQTGTTWANRAWSGRSWSGLSWAADGTRSSLTGRSWSGRSWS